MPSIYASTPKENPEQKTVDVPAPNPVFTVETFGRPKPAASRSIPNNVILKAALAACSRGIAAARICRQAASTTQWPVSARAFPFSPAAVWRIRMAKLFLPEKTISRRQQPSRSLADCCDAPEKWTEVWAHIYLARSSNARSANAPSTNTASQANQRRHRGAQQIADAFIKKA